MAEEKKEVNLDQPFKADEAPAGEPEQAETEVKEVKEEVVEELETEKPRVPYSRFENVSKARREAEAEAEKWRTRALELEESRFSTRQVNGEVPQSWLTLYGDTEETRKAYPLWLQEQEKFVQQAEERAFQRLQEVQKQEAESVRENESLLDEHLEMVGAVAGHDLTEKEQDAILDIIDEYTAKDEDGKYLGAILPADKAWKIYEMNNQVNPATKKSRNSVSNVISATSNGQPTPEQLERDKNWRPGMWRDKVKE